MVVLATVYGGSALAEAGVDKAAEVSGVADTAANRRQTWTG